MFTIIWRKSGSLRSQIDSLKETAKSLKADIQTAEDGAQLAVQNMLSELGTIQSIKAEIANFGV